MRSEIRKPAPVSEEAPREIPPELDKSPELEQSAAEQEEAMISLSRGMRDLRYADLLDTARNNSELLVPIERFQMVDSLERRGWGSVLRNLHQGDTAVSILSSISDISSIKNLNDNIFGSQTTDSIIVKRRQLIESHLNKALNMAGVSAHDLEHVSLEQNYKFGTYKIPKKYNLDAVAIVSKVCAEVDSEMKEYIIGLADDEQSKYPEKAKVLQKFRADINAEGYKMTFGTATVESDDIADVVLAVNGSLQTARAVASEKSAIYGDAFSAEKMTAKIEQTDQIRNKIYQEGNQIVGKDGVVHEIFSGEIGSLVINKDLLREIRKDKLAIQVGQEEILNDLKEYIKGLNIFDTVKPFTADEVDGLREKFDEIDKTAEGVLNGNQEACAKAAEILDKNEKDSHFTSEARFHSEAVKIKNCAYLSLDVLDIGVDQLLDFEQRTQMVVNKKMTFTQASLEAGDAMTKRLRDIRMRAYDICDELGLTKDGRMNGLVGGDELTLAIDLDATDKNGDKIFNGNEKVLNKLILRLKKETSSRVVKTVIAESKRHSSTDNIVHRMNEHLVALKNAEEGARQAKEIEGAVRKLKKFLKDHPDNLPAKSLLGSLDNFVMTEIDGKFIIRTEDGPDTDLNQLSEQLKFLYN
jgi:hypothetical protein